MGGICIRHVRPSYDSADCSSLMEFVDVWDRRRTRCLTKTYSRPTWMYRAWECHIRRICSPNMGIPLCPATGADRSIHENNFPFDVPQVDRRCPARIDEIGGDAQT